MSDATLELKDGHSIDFKLTFTLNNAYIAYTELLEFGIRIDDIDYGVRYIEGVLSPMIIPNIVGITTKLYGPFDNGDCIIYVTGLSELTGLNAKTAYTYGKFNSTVDLNKTLLSNIEYDTTVVDYYLVGYGVTFNGGNSIINYTNGETEIELKYGYSDDFKLEFTVDQFTGFELLEFGIRIGDVDYGIKYVSGVLEQVDVPVISGVTIKMYGPLSNGKCVIYVTGLTTDTAHIYGNFKSTLDINAQIISNITKSAYDTTTLLYNSLGDIIQDLDSNTSLAITNGESIIEQIIGYDEDFKLEFTIQLGFLTEFEFGIRIDDIDYGIKYAGVTVIAMPIPEIAALTIKLYGPLSNGKCSIYVSGLTALKNALLTTSPVYIYGKFNYDSANTTPTTIVSSILKSAYDPLISTYYNAGTLNVTDTSITTTGSSVIEYSNPTTINMQIVFVANDTTTDFKFGIRIEDDAEIYGVHVTSGTITVKTYSDTARINVSVSGNTCTIITDSLTKNVHVYGEFTGGVSLLNVITGLSIEPIFDLPPVVNFMAPSRISKHDTSILETGSTYKIRANVPQGWIMSRSISFYRTNDYDVTLFIFHTSIPVLFGIINSTETSGFYSDLISSPNFYGAIINASSFSTSGMYNVGGMVGATPSNFEIKSYDKLWQSAGYLRIRLRNLSNIPGNVNFKLIIATGANSGSEIQLIYGVGTHTYLQDVTPPPPTPEPIVSLITDYVEYGLAGTGSLIQGSAITTNFKLNFTIDMNAVSYFELFEFGIKKNSNNYGIKYIDGIITPTSSVAPGITIKLYGPLTNGDCVMYVTGMSASTPVYIYGNFTSVVNVNHKIISNILNASYTPSTTDYYKLGQITANDSTISYTNAGDAMIERITGYASDFKYTFNLDMESVTKFDVFEYGIRINDTDYGIRSISGLIEIMPIESIAGIDVNIYGPFEGGKYAIYVTGISSVQLAYIYGIFQCPVDINKSVITNISKTAYSSTDEYKLIGNISFSAPTISTGSILYTSGDTLIEHNAGYTDDFKIGFKIDDTYIDHFKLFEIGIRIGDVLYGVKYIFGKFIEIKVPEIDGITISIHGPLLGGECAMYVTGLTDVNSPLSFALKKTAHIYGKFNSVVSIGKTIITNMFYESYAVTPYGYYSAGGITIGASNINYTNGYGVFKTDDYVQSIEFNFEVDVTKINVNTDIELGIRIGTSPKVYGVKYNGTSYEIEQYNTFDAYSLIRVTKTPNSPIYRIVAFGVDEPIHVYGYFNNTNDDNNVNYIINMSTIQFIQSLFFTTGEISTANNNATIVYGNGNSGTLVSSASYKNNINMTFVVSPHINCEFEFGISIDNSDDIYGIKYNGTTYTSNVITTNGITISVNGPMDTGVSNAYAYSIEVIGISGRNHAVFIRGNFIGINGGLINASILSYLSIYENYIQSNIYDSVGGIIPIGDIANNSTDLYYTQGYGSVASKNIYSATGDNYAIKFKVDKRTNDTLKFGISYDGNSEILGIDIDNGTLTQSIDASSNIFVEYLSSTGEYKIAINNSTNVVNTYINGRFYNLNEIDRIIINDISIITPYSFIYSFTGGVTTKTADTSVYYNEGEGTITSRVEYEDDFIFGFIMDISLNVSSGFNEFEYGVRIGTDPAIYGIKYTTIGGLSADRQWTVDGITIKMYEPTSNVYWMVVSGIISQVAPVQPIYIYGNFDSASTLINSSIISSVSVNTNSIYRSIGGLVSQYDENNIFYTQGVGRIISKIGYITDFELRFKLEIDNINSVGTVTFGVTEPTTTPDTAIVNGLTYLNGAFTGTVNWTSGGVSMYLFGPFDGICTLYVSGFTGVENPVYIAGTNTNTSIIQNNQIITNILKTEFDLLTDYYSTGAVTMESSDSVIRYSNGYGELRRKVAYSDDFKLNFKVNAIVNDFETFNFYIRVDDTTNYGIKYINGVLTTVTEPIINGVSIKMYGPLTTGEYMIYVSGINAVSKTVNIHGDFKNSLNNKDSIVISDISSALHTYLNDYRTLGTVTVESDTATDSVKFTNMTGDVILGTPNYTTDFKLGFKLDSTIINSFTEFNFGIQIGTDIYGISYTTAGGIVHMTDITVAGITVTIYGPTETNNEYSIFVTGLTASTTACIVGTFNSASNVVGPILSNILKTEYTVNDIYTAGSVKLYEVGTGIQYTTGVGQIKSSIGYIDDFKLGFTWLNNTNINIEFGVSIDDLAPIYGIKYNGSTNNGTTSVDVYDGITISVYGPINTSIGQDNAFSIEVIGLTGKAHVLYISGKFTGTSTSSNIISDISIINNYTPSLIYDSVGAVSPIDGSIINTTDIYYTYGYGSITSKSYAQTADDYAIRFTLNSSTTTGRFNFGIRYYNNPDAAIHGIYKDAGGAWQFFGEDDVIKLTELSGVNEYMITVKNKTATNNANNTNAQTYIAGRFYNLSNANESLITNLTIINPYSFVYDFTGAVTTKSPNTDIYYSNGLGTIVSQVGYVDDFIVDFTLNASLTISPLFDIFEYGVCVGTDPTIYGIKYTTGGGINATTQWITETGIIITIYGPNVSDKYTIVVSGIDKQTAGTEKIVYICGNFSSTSPVNANIISAQLITASAYSTSGGFTTMNNDNDIYYTTGTADEITTGEITFNSSTTAMTTDIECRFKVEVDNLPIIGDLSMGLNLYPLDMLFAVTYSNGALALSSNKDNMIINNGTTLRTYGPLDTGECTLYVTSVVASSRSADIYGSISSTGVVNDIIISNLSIDNTYDINASNYYTLGAITMGTADDNILYSSGIGRFESKTNNLTDFKFEFTLDDSIPVDFEAFEFGIIIGANVYGIIYSAGTGLVKMTDVELPNGITINMYSLLTANRYVIYVNGLTSSNPSATIYGYFKNSTASYSSPIVTDMSILSHTTGKYNSFGAATAIASSVSYNGLGEGLIGSVNGYDTDFEMRFKVATEFAGIFDLFDYGIRVVQTVYGIKINSSGVLNSTRHWELSNGVIVNMFGPNVTNDYNIIVTGVSANVSTVYIGGQFKNITNITSTDIISNVTEHLTDYKATGDLIPWDNGTSIYCIGNGNGTFSHTTGLNYDVEIRLTVDATKLVNVDTYSAEIIMQTPLSTGTFGMIYNNGILTTPKHGKFSSIGATTTTNVQMYGPLDSGECVFYITGITASDLRDIRLHNIITNSGSVDPDINSVIVSNISTSAYDNAISNYYTVGGVTLLSSESVVQYDGGECEFQSKIGYTTGFDLKFTLDIAMVSTFESFEYGILIGQTVYGITYNSTDGLIKMTDIITVDGTVINMYGPISPNEYVIVVSGTILTESPAYIYGHFKNSISYVSSSIISNITKSPYTNNSSYYNFGAALSTSYNSQYGHSIIYAGSTESIMGMKMGQDVDFKLEFKLDITLDKFSLFEYGVRIGESIYGIKYENSALDTQVQWVINGIVIKLYEPISGEYTMTVSGITNQTNSPKQRISVFGHFIPNQTITQTIISNINTIEATFVLYDYSNGLVPNYNNTEIYCINNSSSKIKYIYDGVDDIMEVRFKMNLANMTTIDSFKFGFEVGYFAEILNYANGNVNTTTATSWTSNGVAGSTFSAFRYGPLDNGDCTVYLSGITSRTTRFIYVTGNSTSVIADINATMISGMQFIGSPVTTNYYSVGAITMGSNDESVYYTTGYGRLETKVSYSADFTLRFNMNVLINGTYEYGIRIGSIVYGITHATLLGFETLTNITTGSGIEVVVYGPLSGGECAIYVTGLTALKTVDIYGNFENLTSINSSIISNISTPSFDAINTKYHYTGGVSMPNATSIYYNAGYGRLDSIDTYKNDCIINFTIETTIPTDFEFGVRVGSTKFGIKYVASTLTMPSPQIVNGISYSLHGPTSGNQYAIYVSGLTLSKFATIYGTFYNSSVMNQTIISGINIELAPTDSVYYLMGDVIRSPSTVNYTTGFTDDFKFDFTLITPVGFTQFEYGIIIDENKFGVKYDSTGTLVAMTPIDNVGIESVLYGPLTGGECSIIITGLTSLKVNDASTIETAYIYETIVGSIDVNRRIIKDITVDATYNPSLVDYYTVGGVYMTDSNTSVTNDIGYGRLVGTLGYDEDFKFDFTAVTSANTTFEYGVRIGTAPTIYGISYAGTVTMSSVYINGDTTITVTNSGNNYSITGLGIIEPVYIYGEFNNQSGISIKPITNIIIETPYVPPPLPVFNSSSSIRTWNTAGNRTILDSAAAAKIVIESNGDLTHIDGQSATTYTIVFSSKSYPTGISTNASDTDYELIFNLTESWGVDCGVYLGSDFMSDNSDFAGTKNSVYRHYGGYGTAGVTSEHIVKTTIYINGIKYGKISIKSGLNAVVSEFYIIAVFFGTGDGRLPIVKDLTITDINASSSGPLPVVTLTDTTVDYSTGSGTVVSTTEQTEDFELRFNIESIDLIKNFDLFNFGISINSVNYGIKYERIADAQIDPTNEWEIITSIINVP